MKILVESSHNIKVGGYCIRLWVAQEDAMDYDESQLIVDVCKMANIANMTAPVLAERIIGLERVNAVEVQINEVPVYKQAFTAAHRQGIVIYKDWP